MSTKNKNHNRHQPKPMPVVNTELMLLKEQLIAITKTTLPKNPTAILRLIPGECQPMIAKTLADAEHYLISDYQLDPARIGALTEAMADTDITVETVETGGYWNCKLLVIRTPKGCLVIE